MKNMILNEFNKLEGRIIVKIITIIMKLAKIKHKKLVGILLRSHKLHNLVVGSVVSWILRVSGSSRH